MNFIKSVGVTLVLVLLSGCSPSLTLGPKVETRYVVVVPGRPMEVLGDVEVEGRVLDGSGDAVKQQVGGWVMMPPSHWAAIRERLKALAPKGD